MFYDCANASHFVEKYPKVIKDDYQNYFEWLYKRIRAVPLERPSMADWLDNAPKDLVELVFKTFNDSAIPRHKLCPGGPGTQRYRYGTPPVLYAYKHKWKYSHWEELAQSYGHNTLKFGVGIYFHSLVDLWSDKVDRWEVPYIGDFKYVDRIVNHCTNGKPLSSTMYGLPKLVSRDDEENWEICGFTHETAEQFHTIPIEVRRMILQTWIFHPSIRDVECMLLDPSKIDSVPDTYVSDSRVDTLENILKTYYAD